MRKALVVLLLLSACGREVASVTPVREPNRAAIAVKPTPSVQPEADASVGVVRPAVPDVAKRLPTPVPSPLEWIVTEGLTTARVRITPRSPAIGDPVVIEFFMKYVGKEDARKFNVDYWLEGEQGKFERPNCSKPQSVPNKQPLQRRIVLDHTFKYPGPYGVILRAWPACVGVDRDARVRKEVIVRGTPKLPEGEVLLPHSQPRDSTAMGTSNVTIKGDKASGCVWAMFAGERRAAVWPIGYRARFNPLRIYNADDKEVWREGLPRDNAGQPSRYGYSSPRVPVQCRAKSGSFTFG